jgi:hypothetical protein
VHFLDKQLIERANAALLLGLLWGGLAACVVAALAYDISRWLTGW